MATPTERTPDNVPGRYYVDSTCIDCGQCHDTAPEVFGRNEDTGLAFVRHQPLTDAEVTLAEEALGACATSSIGNDGA